MTDPKRLLDEANGSSLQLLAAARNVPEPPPGSLERTLFALGIGTATLSAAASVQAAAARAAGATSSTVAGATSSAAAGATSNAAALPWLSIGKWLAGGFALGAGISATLGAAQEWRGADSRPQPTLTTPAPRLPPTLAEQQPSAAPLATAPPATSAATDSARRRTASSASPAAPSLAAEIEHLDRARKALAAGQAATALVALDGHDALFPAGQLAPEAALLRVRAYSAAGRGAAARELAQSLLRRSTDADYAARVREAAGLDAP